MDGVAAAEGSVLLAPGGHLAQLRTAAGVVSSGIGLVGRGHATIVIPSACRTVTKLPLGPASPMDSMFPWHAAKTGVPASATKSTPLCGMTTCRMGCMRCMLKPEEMRPNGIGRRKPPL